MEGRTDFVKTHSATGVIVIKGIHVLWCQWIFVAFNKWRCWCCTYCVGVVNHTVILFGLWRPLRSEMKSASKSLRSTWKYLEAFFISLRRGRGRPQWMTVQLNNYSILPYYYKMFMKHKKRVTDSSPFIGGTWPFEQRLSKCRLAREAVCWKPIRHQLLLFDWRRR